MVGRPVLVIALGLLTTAGSGCVQLLGITDITADIVGDGSVDDSGSSDVASETGPDNPDAAACPGDLSNVRTGDFTIAFRMQTNQPDKIVALINQRYVCAQTIFWDVQLVNQQIYFELSDSSGEGGYLFINTSSPALNDDRPHDVLITRTNSVVQIVVDGKGVGTRTAGQDLGGLAPLRVGDDVCVGGDGTVKLLGTVTNICVRPN